MCIVPTQPLLYQDKVAAGCGTVLANIPTSFPRFYRPPQASANSHGWKQNTGLNGSVAWSALHPLYQKLMVVTEVLTNLISTRWRCYCLLLPLSAIYCFAVTKAGKLLICFSARAGWVGSVDMAEEGKVQMATEVCSIIPAPPERACVPVASCQRESSALQGMASKLTQKKSFFTNLGTVYFHQINPKGW